MCSQDFRQNQWLCATCETSAQMQAPEDSSAFPMGFSWIFLASFALILIGMILMMIASSTQGNGIASGGAVILIGPIPIILGNGPESNWLILLAAIITATALVASLLTRRKMRS